MYTRRQANILKILINNPNGIFSKDLAINIGVSSRTIRKEISEINKNDNVITSKSNTGYTIEKSKIDDIKKAIAITSNDLDELQFRKFELLGTIIFNDNSTLECLSDALDLSIQTTKKEITLLKKYISNYTTTEMFTIVSNKVVVNKNEDAIRTLIFNIIKHLLEVENDIDNYIELLTNGNINLENIDNLFMEIEDICDTEGLLQVDLILFTYCTYFSIIRNKFNKQLEKKHHKIKHFKLLELLNANNLNENDIEKLDCLYDTFLNKYSSSIDDFTRIVLAEYIEAVFEKYSIDITSNEKVNESLLIHLEYLLRRVESNYENRNPLKKEVKLRYPYSYEIAMLLVPIIYKYKNKYLLDDEVSFIAIYIENYINIYNQKIKAIFVSNRKSILDTKILMWVDKYFHNHVEVIDVIEESLIDEYEMDNVDLVLSKSDKLVVLNKDIHIFTDMPNINDSIKLNKIIKSINYHKKIKNVLHNFIKLEDLYIVESTKFSEIMHSVSEDLKQEEVIESVSEFVNDIVEREKVYPTNVDNRVLVPHPLFTFTNKTKVKVILCKEGLSDKKEVKIMFLLALKDKLNVNLNLLFNYLKVMLKEEVYLDSIIESKDINELYFNIFDFSKFNTK